MAPNRRPKRAALHKPFMASRTPDDETYKIKQNKDLFADFGLAGMGFEKVE
jgi:hypothetical protein